MKYDYCVFVGRFQPFHVAHYAILQEALKNGEKVIVVLGSHNKAQNIKNPWTTAERQWMIDATLSEDERNRVEYLPVKDYLYNDNQWIVELQQKIKMATNESESVALIGHDSDRTSFYLKLFPQWEVIDCNPAYPLHATEIRALYFTHNNDFKRHVHQKTAEYLETYKSKPAFSTLKDEYDFIENYKEQWRGAPFPPTFNTVDSVVIKSGHVLVVRRKGKPGRGLIALPGGFLNQWERTLDGAIRELKEETGIKVNVGDLRDAVADQRVFDHPDRSLRGRTITHSFFINLKSGELPSVKGMDDADKAWWMPLSEFYTREAEFFEDHFHIINFFVSKY